MDILNITFIRAHPLLVAITSMFDDNKQFAGSPLT